MSSHLKLAAGIGAMLSLSGALVGFAVSLFIPHHYTVRATAAFTRVPAVIEETYLADAGRLFEAAAAATRRTQSLELMIRRSSYFARIPFLQPAEELHTRLRIQRVSLSGGLTGATIEYEDDDADTALEVVRLALSEFGRNAAIAANAQKASSVTAIVEPPNARLTGMTPLILSGIGFMAGLVTGIIVAVASPRKELTSRQGLPDSEIRL